MLGYDFLWHRTYAAVATRPIDNHQFTARLQHAFHLCEEPETVFYLEEGIGEEHGIKRCIAQMRAARFLDVAPDCVDNVLMMYMRIEFNMLQHVLLHVYRVDLPAVPHDRCRGTRVVSTTSAEVADFHPLAQAELEDILVGRTKFASHTYKIPRPASTLSHLWNKVG